MIFVMYSIFLDTLKEDQTYIDVVIHTFMGLLLVLATPFIIMIDICLSPIYLLAFILYRIKLYKKRKRQLNKNETPDIIGRVDGVDIYCENGVYRIKSKKYQRETKGDKK